MVGRVENHDGTVARVDANRSRDLRGEVILRAGDRAAESLYIIQKGGVKLALRSGIGKELTLDMRSEGEIFGVLSLMGGDVARLDVTAVEETICYCIPAAAVQELMASHQITPLMVYVKQ